MLAPLSPFRSDDQSFLIGLLRSIDRQALKQNFVDLAALQRAVSVVTMDVGAKVEEESLKERGCRLLHAP